MGSKISPILANIVMEDIEILVKHNITKKYKTRLNYFFRFVDDIFTIVLNEYIDIILLEFNSYDPNI